jgi:hypothetical protein
MFWVNAGRCWCDHNLSPSTTRFDQHHAGWFAWSPWPSGQDGVAADLGAAVPKMPRPPGASLVQQPGEKLTESLKVCRFAEGLEDLYVIEIEDFKAIRHGVLQHTADWATGDAQTHEARSREPLPELVFGRSARLVWLPRDLMDFTGVRLHDTGLFHAWGNGED